MTLDGTLETCVAFGRCLVVLGKINFCGSEVGIQKCFYVRSRLSSVAEIFGCGDVLHFDEFQ